MSEFLVETYAPRDAADTVAARVDEIVLAADEVSEEKRPVRLLRVIFVPEDETCFYLYRSASADAVREAVTRARLRLERLTEAVSITAPRTDHRPPLKGDGQANCRTSTDQGARRRRADALACRDGDPGAVRTGADGREGRLLDGICG